MTKMTKKNKLLLSIAIDAVNYGEGADFEMREIIGEGGYEEEIREHFPHSVKEDWDSDDIATFIQDKITTLLQKLSNQ